MTKITFIQHAYKKSCATCVEMEVITNRVKELEYYIKQAKEYIKEKEVETKLIRNKVETGTILTPSELFKLSTTENSINELMIIIKEAEKELLQPNLGK